MVQIQQYDEDKVILDSLNISLPLYSPGHTGTLVQWLIEEVLTHDDQKGTYQVRCRKLTAARPMLMQITQIKDYDDQRFKVKLNEIHNSRLIAGKVEGGGEEAFLVESEGQKHLVQVTYYYDYSLFQILRQRQHSDTPWSEEELLHLALDLITALDKVHLK